MLEEERHTHGGIHIICVCVCLSPSHTIIYIVQCNMQYDCVCDFINIIII